MRIHRHRGHRLENFSKTSKNSISKNFFCQHPFSHSTSTSEHPPKLIPIGLSDQQELLLFHNLRLLPKNFTNLCYKFSNIWLK
jgi:hypothetical protein